MFALARCKLRFPSNKKKKTKRFFFLFFLFYDDILSKVTKSNIQCWQRYEASSHWAHRPRSSFTSDHSHFYAFTFALFASTRTRLLSLSAFTWIFIVVHTNSANCIQCYVRATAATDDDAASGHIYPSPEKKKCRNKKTGKRRSWGTISVCCCLFFPLFHFWIQDFQ